eukprot:Polyplicarium_translucidae@DN101_c0_g1_i1.p1
MIDARVAVPAVAAAAFAALGSLLPLPYMDEEFHAPQASRICSGDFRWDPKITTPPGLYLVSCPLVWGARLCGVDQPALMGCRLTSAVASVVLGLPILLRIGRLLHPQAAPAHVAARAVRVWLLPLSSFFYSWCYTDGLSLWAALAAYCLHLERRDVAACLVGAVSCFFRQTNVVWVCFLCIPRVLERRHWSAAVPHCLLGAAFACFLHLNGGVALGDRAAHRPTPHPAQIVYLLLFLLTVCSPAAWAAVRRPAAGPSAVAAAAAAAALRWGSVAHPYLLSDNRHLTFYLWRRVLSKPAAQVLLSAAVGVTAPTLMGRVLPGRPRGERLWFVVAAVAALAPAALLEPRYFALPAAVFALLG